MTHHTLPAFTGKLTHGNAETKQQSRTRNDRYASSIYSKRPLIDRYNDDRALRAQIEEVWDE